MPTTKTRRAVKSAAVITGESEAPREWLTTDEVARILDRTPRTILRMAKQGVLKMNRPGRTQPRYDRSQVIELARQQGIDVP